MALIGNSNSEKIYNFLTAEGYSKAGASGILGNLDAESGLISNRLEMRYTNTLGSDTYYTAAVNNKTYTKNQFINDRAGYGIAQWTYYTRKRGLYEMTVEQGVSIADLETQLKYLVKELKGYTNLDKFLRETDSVNDASDKVLKDFERPAVLNYDDRRALSQKYYDKYADGIRVSDDDTVVNNDNANDSEYKTYTVAYGDSWWGIAAKELGSGTKMVELAKFNGLSTNTMLHEGDIIRLPILKDEVVNAPTNNNSKKYTTYIVRSGDSWWGIASRKMGSGTKMNELAKYNNRSTSSILHPGQVLRIPCKEVADTIIVKSKSYTVKKGDTWASIASNEMGSRSKMGYLASFNGMTTKSILNAGKVLKIPK